MGGHYVFNYQEVPASSPSQKSVGEILFGMPPSERGKWIQENADNPALVSFFTHLSVEERQQKIAEFERLTPFELSKKLAADQLGLPVDFNINEAAISHNPLFRNLLPHKEDELSSIKGSDVTPSFHNKQ